MNEFSYSVVRVVPDPVREEAINVGVAVVSKDQSSGRLLYTKQFRTRLSVIRKDFPYRAVLAAMEDLRVFLGLESQLPLAGKTSPGRPLYRLEVAGRYFEGQLQLLGPRSYRAESLNEAAEQLFQRFVKERLPSEIAPKVAGVTAAEMRQRIWHTVSAWRERNLIVERTTWLRGKEARHPADFVVRNGSPRAALFALPANDEEKTMAFLYRDSLPTIAKDMVSEIEGFQVIGVLPDLELNLGGPASQFIQETRSLLSDYPGVQTVFLSQLDQLEEEFTRHLL